MNKVVFDSSAIIALLNQEKGFDIVEKYLSNCIISAVNLSEAVVVLMKVGISQKQAEDMLIELIEEIVPFDQQQAFVAAKLRIPTKNYGLSLGDRACLALGLIKKLTVITADKIWMKLKLNIKVQCIR
ncbi:MAG: type II toxin-antitoxin system VapC family toxin [Pseudomonadota bacterium]